MKSILITGAYGGMGLCAVKRFASLGYTVFALDICKKGEDIAGVIPVVTDLTDEESVIRARNEVLSHTDTLSAVLHFAGMYNLDSLVEMEDTAFRKILDVNLRSAYLVNRLFLPLLKPDSRILITTSELAILDPLPFTGIYAVTKAALDKYAFSLAMELQLLGIRVSVLRAGAVNTGMLGVSTAALDKFCEGTSLYTCNAARFKSIVERVEARSVSPERIAEKCEKIIAKRRPRFAYGINRNPLLVLLNLLPKRVQLFAIKTVLKPPKSTDKNV
ncbi:MAG: SDR family NAD(P)-dependent oxidoreductase [Clostridia bacterium]|nr:SDR family NAD(P)-dependent oxidoreductase [Clostridia bacterium]